ncbi:MAG: CaiB/BaiF CoA transferase family protein, partial [Acidimicrobiales bacterium]
MTAPLTGIRVVDLTDASGELCGRILSDLGAEVVKVEPPGGCEGRRLPPWHADTGDSLFWRAFGRGKQSVVLDLDDPADGERLADLIASADVAVLSGSMSSLGLDTDALRQRNPGLILASITPYGTTGPRAHWPAADLTVEAAAGRLMLQGDGDRPPVPIGFPQSGPQGAGAATADIVIALYERERSGRGQDLDTSMQIAVTWTLMNATGYGAVTDDDPASADERRAEPRSELTPGVPYPGVERVADGWVSITLPVLGAVTVDSFARLMGWVAADGALPADLVGVEWGDFVTAVRTDELSRADAGRGITALRAWLSGHTKADLHRRAVSERVLLAPVATSEDLLADPQLAAREFWVERDQVREAGPWARMPRTPLIDPTPAPDLGQH